jgi:hypothetical protein
MPPRSAITAKRFLSILIGVVLGTSLLAITFGYILGSQQEATITTGQEDYITGIVQGTRFKIDFEKWQSEKSPEFDYRSSPATRCAGLFYPTRDLAMAGCLQALQERPEGGYTIPTPR